MYNITNKFTHFSFRFYRLHVPLGHLPDGFTSPQRFSHNRVAHGHHEQW